MQAAAEWRPPISLGAQGRGPSDGTLRSVVGGAPQPLLSRVEETVPLKNAQVRTCGGACVQHAAAASAARGLVLPGWSLPPRLAPRWRPPARLTRVHLPPAQHEPQPQPQPRARPQSEPGGPVAPAAEPQPAADGEPDHQLRGRGLRLGQGTTQFNPSGVSCRRQTGWGRVNSPSPILRHRPPPSATAWAPAPPPHATVTRCSASRSPARRRARRPWASAGSSSPPAATAQQPAPAWGAAFSTCTACQGPWSRLQRPRGACAAPANCTWGHHGSFATALPLRPWTTHVLRPPPSASVPVLCYTQPVH